MEILAVLRRRTEAFSEDEFTPLLAPEAEGVRNLYAQGIVRQAWTRQDVPGACLLLEADSVEIAANALAQLPLLERNMSEMTLLPLRGYRGFGPQTT